MADIKRVRFVRFYSATAFMPLEEPAFQHSLICKLLQSLSLTYSFYIKGTLILNNKLTTLLQLSRYLSSNTLQLLFPYRLMEVSHDIRQITFGAHLNLFYLHITPVKKYNIRSIEKSRKAWNCFKRSLFSIRLKEINSPGRLAQGWEGIKRCNFEVFFNKSKSIVSSRKLALKLMSKLCKKSVVFCVGRICSEIWLGEFWRRISLPSDSLFLKA